VADEPSVDPKAPTRKQKVPQELPYGVSIEGLGLRETMAAPSPHATQMMPAQMMRTRAFNASGAFGAGGAPPPPSAAAPKRPSPPRMEEKAKTAAPGSGMLGAVKGFFKKEAPRQDEADADDLGESAPATEGGAARPFDGRIVRRRGDEVTIEIAVAEDGTWQVEDEVELIDEEGRVVRGTVVRERTTGDSSITAGQTLRLVVVLEAGGGGAAEMGARLRMGAIEIVLVESVV